MAEDAHPRLEAGQLPYLVGDAKHAPLLAALRHHDDARPLAALPTLAKLVAERNEIGGYLGNEDVLGAPRDADAERDVAARASHHLDQEEPLVRGRGVADTVDRLERGVDGGVEADREVRPVHVVVDRPGHTRHLHPLLGREQRRAVKRPFATDDDEPLDPRALEDRRRAGTPLGIEEFLAPRRPQHRPPALDDVGDLGAGERAHLAGEETRIPAPDADHLEPLAERVTDRGADGRIHAGGIAAARQDADASHTRYRRTGGAPSARARRSAVRARA